MRLFVHFLIFFVLLTNAVISRLSKNFPNEDDHVSIMKLIANQNITFRCPPNTIQSQIDNKTCYLFVKESKNFSDAESFCNDNGGNLAAVLDIFVNQFLSFEADKKFTSFDKFWIGGTIQTVKTNAATAVNIWKWTKDDRLMIFSDWDPTSTTTGNCSGVQLNSLWSAIDCSLKNPFVCQVPAEFSYCNEGWNYFNLTNSCYGKFAVTSRISQEASEISCKQENGHLASIHTVEENQFIGDLMSIGWCGNSYASVFWIGARRNDNSSNWYWTDNSKFDYANWGYKYDYTNMVCSGFWSDWTDANGKPLEWNARFCSDGLNRYLCKKSPNVEPFD